MKASMSMMLAAALPLAGLAAQPLELAVRGQSPAYTIVVPAAATPTQQYAAEELQCYAERLTGVKLPIANDAQPVPAKSIRIVTAADQNLGEDGFRLQAKDGALTIAASSLRGSLYGVYELLERFGGCRWYSSWCEKVPEAKAFTVPGDLDDTQKPAFEMRLPFWYDVITHNAFAARIRCNCTWRKIEEKYGGDTYRFGGGLGCCHTLERLVPIEKYGKTHPEYFALRDGQRRVNPPSGHNQWYLQPCLTNPDVFKIVVEGVKARIRKDPHARFYGVSQNDNWMHCQCPTCAAVDKEEGSHAGTVVRFVNAVAAEVEKEFPNVVIETLAYQFSRQPPTKTKLRHNVIPCLCSIECDFARPIPESPYPQNVKFCSDIVGWTSQTDMLYVWDYVTNFRHYPYPLTNVYALQGNVKFFRDHKVRCLFEQGAYQGRHGDFAELKAWLLAKWMWNPELPIGPLLDDFFAGYYGKGAPFARAYFEEVHRIHREWSKNPATPSCIYEDVISPALPDAFLEKAAGLWAQAEAATKGDPVHNYNVRMGAFSIDYTRVERARRRGLLTPPKLVLDPNWTWKNDTFKKLQPVVRSLLARMDEAKDIRLSEGGGRDAEITAAWRALAAVNAGEPKRRDFAPVVTLEDRELFQTRPNTYSQTVDDPLAADGKAIKLLNTHYEWCVTLPFNQIAFPPNAQYRLRVRLRVEPKAGQTGEAFWMGVYDNAIPGGVSGKRPKVTEVKPGYQWYELGPWQPKKTQYFWIGPGWYDKTKNETTSIEGVWLDQVELVRIDSK